MDVQVKPVVITDINIKPVGSSMVYVLETNGGKFSFFNKKQDGSDTKAYSQFSKFNFKKGDSVEIAYTEKVSDKVNAYTGKPYVNYSVMYFVTADENTPAVTMEQAATFPTARVVSLPKNDNFYQDVNDKLESLASRMRAVEDFLGIAKEGDINISDIPF